MGKLVVLNGTDEEWKIAVYPHVVGKISKEEKKVKVRNRVYLSVLIYQNPI